MGGTGGLLLVELGPAFGNQGLLLVELAQGGSVVGGGQMKCAGTHIWWSLGPLWVKLVELAQTGGTSLTFGGTSHSWWNWPKQGV